jgi:hypothetical protein
MSVVRSPTQSIQNHPTLPHMSSWQYTVRNKYVMMSRSVKINPPITIQYRFYHPMTRQTHVLSLGMPLSGTRVSSMLSFNPYVGMYPGGYSRNICTYLYQQIPALIHTLKFHDILTLSNHPYSNAAPCPSTDCQYKHIAVPILVYQSKVMEQLLFREKTFS